MKNMTLVLIAMVLIGFLLTACAKKEDVPKKEEAKKKMKASDLSIQANLVFFYYKDLEAAHRFYEDVIGLEMVLDYGFAKLFRISQTSYIGLVDERKGMHSSDEPKSVTLSFVTEEIDEWYQYLVEKGVEMRGPLKDATRHPTRGFVAYDPEGYFLEFERFLDHPQNERLLQKLSQHKALYPSAEKSGLRPNNLGLQANIIWLYYRDLEEAQRFYEDVFGFELHVDQGFAKVYASSPTAYVGLVDEAQGLHRFAEEKAVTLSFISEQIDDWYAYLLDRGLEMKDDLADAERIPVRAFVTYDIAGYYVEFDRFLPYEQNTKILQYLQGK
jgi:predicted enzyme related to lactoylglutathione lyase